MDIWLECHRPPPGAQAGLERWSLVFFTRPGDSSILSALTGESTKIAEAVLISSEAPIGDVNNKNSKFDTRSTAGEWFSRRIKNQRINNREVCINALFILSYWSLGLYLDMTDKLFVVQKGPETWMASRGTEQAEVWVSATWALINYWSVGDRD